MLIFIYLFLLFIFICRRSDSRHCNYEFTFHAIMAEEFEFLSRVCYHRYWNIRAQRHWLGIFSLCAV